ncbi:MAG: hypothetical protein QGG74_04395 [Phycisphaerales bacterium]|nr:hypothetical protein [Phycisphaerales bacterium]
MHGRFAVAALMMVLVLLESACTMHDGGYMPMSAGTWSPMTFRSTAAAPKTVAIVDIRTGETIFEVDIPMGQQLSIEFFMDKHRHEHPESPDYMKYTLHTIGDVIGYLDTRVDVPAPWNRRVDVFLRSPEAYTPPDPTRPVEPLDVPLPEAAVKKDLPTDVPVPEEEKTPVEAAAPETPDAPKAEPEKPKALPGVDTDEPQKPEESPKAESEKPKAPPGVKTAEAQKPAPPEPVEPHTPPEAPHPTSPISTMTWTDTGHTRRVWVTDIRTGTRTFEVDVPEGSDLVLHFFDMWTPKGGDQDVQSMHWEIVPAGGHVTVPAHHATVPSEPFRRISEQGVEPPKAPPPPVDAIEKPPTADKDTPPPPIDLLDDADDGHKDESKPETISPS